MIATIQQLRELSGLKRRSAIKRWLQDNGVLYFEQANGDPATTLDAINRALYGGGRGNEPDYSQPCNYRPRSTRNTGATTTSTRTNGMR